MLTDPITGVQAAFVAGLVTSLHCAGMCGPLACALLPAGRGDPVTNQVAYHASRAASYTVVGALGGAIGQMPLRFGIDGWLLVMPWLMVAYFVATAFRLDAWLPRSRAVGSAVGAAAARVRSLPPAAAASGLGFLTPLLPCGPLYFAFSFAVFTGSAVRGAELMFAFAAGTVPLLALAQNRYTWLQRALPGAWFHRVRATVALAAALVLTWRLRASFGLEGPSIESFVCG